jgi:predicted nucleotidyltransferase
MSEHNIVLLGEYGSTAMGVANEQSDHDFMGVYVPTKEQMLGLSEAKNEHLRSAAAGERSQPGTSETALYPLREFVKLAAKGNPTVGSLLWLPEFTVAGTIGRELLAHRELFLSKRVGRAYLGYMKSQIKRIEEESTRTNRPELVAKFGYDTKFAYHAYRLGVQGIQLVREHHLEIPLQGLNLSVSQSIRAGEIDRDIMLRLLYNVQAELSWIVDEDTSPDEPHWDYLNQLLVDWHEDEWFRQLLDRQRERYAAVGTEE